jgi:alpha-beta hydrolase superfamily lysophospholipase
MMKDHQRSNTTTSGALKLGIAVLMLIIMTQASKPVMAAASVPPETIEVAADLPDSSVELVGYLIMPPKIYRKVKPPLVVVLHQLGETHAAWRKLWESLYPEGIAVFAIDLRGQGLSIYDLKNKRNRAPNTFLEGEFLKYPDDVKFLVDTCIALYGDRIDASKIAVVGASIGANTGLLYALKEPRVKYLAMISPGLDYQGLRVAPALAKIKGVDIFIAAGDEDIYSNLSVDLLTDIYGDKVKYELYSSMYHGNRLVNTTPDLFHRLLVDIVSRLRPDIPIEK